MQYCVFSASNFSPTLYNHRMKILSICILFFFVACKQGNLSKKNYPEYKLTSISGKTLEITKIKNRLDIPSQTLPMLFVFIRPSCIPCFQGIEHLKRIADEYRGKISFIPVLITDESNPNEYLNEALIINKNYKLDFDFYFSADEKNFLENFDRQTDTNFIILYDSKLRLVQEYEGLVPEEMLEFDINRVLNQMEKRNDSKPKINP